MIKISFCSRFWFRCIVFSFAKHKVNRKESNVYLQRSLMHWPIETTLTAGVCMCGWVWGGVCVRALEWRKNCRCVCWRRVQSKALISDANDRRISHSVLNLQTILTVEEQGRETQHFVHRRCENLSTHIAPTPTFDVFNALQTRLTRRKRRLRYWVGAVFIIKYETIATNRLCTLRAQKCHIIAQTTVWKRKHKP